MSLRAQVLEDLRGVRAAREDVVARVAAARRDVAACYVTKLVEAVPGVGKVRGRRLLAELGVPPRCRCADLGVDVRDALLGALR
jgi:hypothetical protein